ncbi:MAG: hypothetical protein RMY16_26965 [Nostoc sp. DedQUE12b]|uniref:hypothetical protein n=1 Tax=Nostoc sp. DedQUE12b TaxID=3075398 RepID=UPI002AD4F857|nr:hypothetical protein [Nostoc sp. DedQUE12b]MDZ8089162.1 hypothetical protein [Nostoc sp. DedQUE12b]
MAFAKRLRQEKRLVGAASRREEKLKPSPLETLARNLSNLFRRVVNYTGVAADYCRSPHSLITNLRSQSHSVHQSFVSSLCIL